MLGGGCFFNRLLAARVTARLQRSALAVRRPRTVSCGDAGLALGQAWVAQQQLDAMPVLPPGRRQSVPEESLRCA